MCPHPTHQRDHLVDIPRPEVHPGDNVLGRAGATADVRVDGEGARHVGLERHDTAAGVEDHRLDQPVLDAEVLARPVRGLTQPDHGRPSDMVEERSQVGAVETRIDAGQRPCHGEQLPRRQRAGIGS